MRIRTLPLEPECSPGKMTSPTSNNSPSSPTLNLRNQEIGKVHNMDKKQHQVATNTAFYLRILSNCHGARNDYRTPRTPPMWTSWVRTLPLVSKVFARENDIPYSLRLSTRSQSLRKCCVKCKMKCSHLKSTKKML